MKSSIIFIWVCGIISPIFFVIVFLIDGATRPDYDPFYHWISHLSLGERGWIGIVNLIIMGLNSIILGIFAKKSLHGKRSTWGRRLIIIIGIALIFCGVFVIDPLMGYPKEAQGEHLTIIGIFHIMSAFLMYEALILTCFVLANQFSNWFSVYSIICGSLILLSSAICGTFILLDITKIFIGGPSGLFERISMIIGCGWIVVFSGLLIKGIRE